MQQFNFPTTILYGQGSLKEFSNRIKKETFKKVLIVTDQTLVQAGIVGAIDKHIKAAGKKTAIFDQTHGNPVEEDVVKASTMYKKEGCDSVVAVGGGSPMDTAKVVLILATHGGELADYDAAAGGHEKIMRRLPSFYAIPTTAGTGSEVGRSAVIILKKTNAKTTFFHPELVPKIAVLEPELTLGLPALVTAATGIDALTHCLEAFFVPSFSPLCDGIAIEGLRLIIENLPVAVKERKNVDARAKMLIAASMGATAFQKDLGMAHSMAHPLSAECGLHHGLANALVLPACLEFLEQSSLSADNQKKMQRVGAIFQEFGFSKPTLSETCKYFISSLGIRMGLENHGVQKDQLAMLSKKAYDDPCHMGNMVTVTAKDLLNVYERAFS